MAPKNSRELFSIGGIPSRSPKEAKYFAAWIERTIDATTNYPDWNSPVEKEYVLKRLAEARAVYEELSTNYAPAKQD